MQTPNTSYRAILALVLPALIQGLLTTIVFITDRLILARYSELALGSMQISGPIGWISTTLFGSFAVGMASYIGRSWGANQQEHAARYLGAGLWLSLLMGIILASLGVLFTPELCDLMVSTQTSTPELRSLGMLYLYYLFPSTPLQIMSSALVSGHQSIGNTKHPMYATLGAGLVNLTVSVVLVHGLLGCPRMGVEGAAIGTVCAFSFSFLANLYPVLTRLYPLSVRRPNLEELKKVARLSLPAFGERGLYHGAYFIFCAYIGHLGNQAMSVHQGLIALESLGFISAHAFGVAAFTLSAQHLGANDPASAMLAIRRTAHLGVGALALFGTVLVMFSEQLIAIFVQSDSSVGLGSVCLMLVAYAQPLMALTDIFSGAHRGAGDTKTPMWAAVIGPVSVRLCACWYLAFSLDLGLVGIWLGSSLDWLVRTCFMALRTHRGKWLALADANMEQRTRI
jgi:putative MATE family efflux protein